MKDWVQRWAFYRKRREEAEKKKASREAVALKFASTKWWSANSAHIFKHCLASDRISLFCTESDTKQQLTATCQEEAATPDYFHCFTKMQKEVIVCKKCWHKLDHYCRLRSSLKSDQLFDNITVKQSYLHIRTSSFAMLTFDHAWLIILMKLKLLS